MADDNELFLLEYDDAVESYGDQIVSMCLKEFACNGFKELKCEMVNGYETQNWKKIDSITHRYKTTFMYFGATNFAEMTMKFRDHIKKDERDKMNEYYKKFMANIDGLYEVSKKLFIEKGGVVEEEELSEPPFNPGENIPGINVSSPINNENFVSEINNNNPQSNGDSFNFDDDFSDGPINQNTFVREKGKTILDDLHPVVLDEEIYAFDSPFRDHERIGIEHTLHARINNTVKVEKKEKTFEEEYKEYVEETEKIIGKRKFCSLV